MKKTKKLVALIMVAVMVMSLFAGCGKKADNTVTVGICNFVDDASLNQIIDNIKTRLNEIAKEKNVTLVIKEQNCQTDATLLSQIVDNFIADKVDLMIGVATPVAMVMQSKTEENKIPVIFAAVSDPIGAGLVASMDAPGANVTGTSDALDTTAIMNLICAQNPGIDKVGLLYNIGQDSSTAAIAAAKKYLTEKGITIVEKTGTNVTEIQAAADALVAEGVKAVFTPSDNTVMEAELSIYERLAQGGVQHYAGADSFALNGAFVGYGVDYANLGVETANMAAKVLFDKADISKLAVMTFDNGTATVNTETCATLGFDYETVKTTFAPLCTKVQSIKTAESFN